MADGSNIRHPMVQRSSGVELLYDPKLRRQMGIESNDQPTSAVVELNLLYPEGLSAAVKQRPAFRSARRHLSS